MTGFQYLKNRMSELFNHGRRGWLFTFRGWTLCLIKEAK